MSVFYDTHAHIDYPDFQSDLDAVIQRANDADITRIITIGTDIEGSKRAIAIAEKFQNVYAAVGWHPTHVMEAPDDIRPALRDLAKHPKVVAIGETGLDYHRPPETGLDAYKAKQGEIFRQQMEVAADLGLNCVIHQRDSFNDVIAQMEPFRDKTRGVFHCFSEPIPSLTRILDLGSLVSFTGLLTFKTAQNARDALAAAPADRFMLETDCPFLAPVPYRGKRCEPAYVKEIATLAAQVRNCTLEELSEQTCRTAENFFRFQRSH
jgi:TatD DNase family protein